MPTGFLIPIAISESHNSDSWLFSEKITNQQRKQNEALRDAGWAVPVIVTLYRSFSTAQRELQKIVSGLRVKRLGQHFTSLDTDLEGQWPGQSCNVMQSRWVEFSSLGKKKEVT